MQVVCVGLGRKKERLPGDCCHSPGETMWSDLEELRNKGLICAREWTRLGDPSSNYVLCTCCVQENMYLCEKRCTETSEILLCPESERPPH